MPSLTDGAIRQAIKRVAKSRQQMSLADGEGRGTGRLVLILKPMPARVTAEWMAQQWRAGRRTKSKIGSYPALSLSGAREIFKRDFADTILKGSSIKIAVDARPGTVADLFEAYVKNLKDSGKPSWPKVENCLNMIVDTLGGNRLARDVTPDDVLGILRPIYERGKRALADHVRSYIRSAFSWGIKSERDYRTSSPRRFRLLHNPAADIPTEPKVVGTRWLNEPNLCSSIAGSNALTRPCIRLTPALSAFSCLPDNGWKKLLPCISTNGTPRSGSSTGRKPRMANRIRSRSPRSPPSSSSPSSRTNSDGSSLPQRTLKSTSVRARFTTSCGGSATARLSRSSPIAIFGERGKHWPARLACRKKFVTACRTTRCTM